MSEETPELPGLREVYRGRAEVRAWVDEILEIFESPHNELERTTELSGDRVLLKPRMHRSASRLSR
jgi:hypothetical protein